MNLEEALEIVNDPSLSAYCEYLHENLFAKYGEFEFGIDDQYDDIVYAYAFVAVEFVLNEGLLEIAPYAADAGESEGGSEG
ncbi:MAG: hypothetical protein HY876_02640 [Coriobacteriales bacterium]|nr:hypothetical protein [Coriobacteriales bacterium]